MIKRVDLPPYTINKKELKRFDQRNTIFGRMLYDEKSDFFKKEIYDNIKEIISKNKKDYSHVEFAKVMGSWAVYDYFSKAFSWKKLLNATSIMKKPLLEKYTITDKTAITNEVKKIAKIYGASLVGITKINHNWIYLNDLDGKLINIPEEYKFAIVIVIKMDPAKIIETPSFNACAETGLVYSYMAFCIGCLAEFIRYLGYKAIPMGNDTALSIPLAIDAGLGELGRNGLLITPEYGPCVRICKVFTNLPLEIDHPIKFGVKEFCKKCKKCADACEVDAIQIDDEPSYNVACRSNSTGILRWAVNQDKCYKFWIENGGDCSNCIASCPFFPSI
jgi:hypothetical protein